MRQFWKTWTAWFAGLLAFFVVANLAGTVRPMGRKPFRSTGFPFTIATWGAGVEESFDWSALALDVAVAVGVSGAVAWACAWARLRRVAVLGRAQRPGSTEQPLEAKAVKALKLLLVPGAVMAAAWVVTFVLLPKSSFPGPHTHVQANYSLSLWQTAVVECAPGGELKLRGFFYYWCGDLKAAQWYDAANLWNSEQLFTDTGVGSSGRMFIDQGDGDYVPYPGPVITYWSSTGGGGWWGIGDYQLREWSCGGERIYREERWGYSGLLLVLVPGLIGLATFVLLVVWTVRKRKSSAPDSFNVAVMP